MPLGRNHFIVANSRLGRLYRRTLGIEDFHSHFRWRAVRDLIQEVPRTLEVGANSGLMSFEVAAAHPQMKIVASEFEPALVATAQRIASLTPFSNVEVVQDDLSQLGTRGPFDQVLAIDVLEHIEDDKLALAQIRAVLVPNGVLVISVPTPEYPNYFGRDFADSLGHVRDGYSPEALSELLAEAGFLVQVVRPYGFTVMSRCCRIVYGQARGPRRTLVLSTLLRPLALLGELVEGRLAGSRLHTSVAVLATLPPG